MTYRPGKTRIYEQIRALQVRNALLSGYSIAITIAAGAMGIILLTQYLGYMK